MSEEKNIFDPKCVHFMWDDELEGKKGFFSDSIEYLTMYVEVNATEHKRCAKRNCQNGSYPFSVLFDGDSDSFKFFYYDPLYDIKWAWKNGEQIQARPIKSTVLWLDWYNDDWMPDCYEYRVKPEVQSTYENVCVYETAKVCGTCKYKDLPYSCTSCKECMEDDVDSGEKSMWEPREVKKRRMTNRELAKWLAQSNGECVCDDISMTCWRYVYSEADTPVRDGAHIRGWDETEWHEPEVEEE